MKGPYKWWIVRCVVAVVSLFVPALVMGANLISPGIIQGSIWGANIGMILIILVIAGALSMLPSLRGIYMRMTYQGDKLIGSLAYAQGWLGPGARLYLEQRKRQSSIITVKEIVEPKKAKNSESPPLKLRPIEGADIPLGPDLRITILKPAV